MKIKKMIEVIEEFIHCAKNGIPHCLTFKPCAKMTEKERQTLQDSLDYHFDIWRNTWILPKLEGLKFYLENELGKKRKEKNFV